MSLGDFSIGIKVEDKDLLKALDDVAALNVQIDQTIVKAGELSAAFMSIDFSDSVKRALEGLGGLADLPARMAAVLQDPSETMGRRRTAADVSVGEEAEGITAKAVLETAGIISPLNKIEEILRNVEDLLRRGATSSGGFTSDNTFLPGGSSLSGQGDFLLNNLLVGKFEPTIIQAEGEAGEELNKVFKTAAEGFDRFIRASTTAVTQLTSEASGAIGQGVNSVLQQISTDITDVRNATKTMAAGLGAAVQGAGMPVSQEQEIQILDRLMKSFEKAGAISKTIGGREGFGTDPGEETISDLKGSTERLSVAAEKIIESAVKEKESGQKLRGGQVPQFGRQEEVVRRELDRFKEFFVGTAETRQREDITPEMLQQVQTTIEGLRDAITEASRPFDPSTPTGGAPGGGGGSGGGQALNINLQHSITFDQAQLTDLGNQLKTAFQKTAQDVVQAKINDLFRAANVGSPTFLVRDGFR